MQEEYDCYVVVQEKRIPENLVVSADFMDALLCFIKNEYCFIEFWKDGKKAKVCHTIEEMNSAGIYIHVNRG